MLRCHVFRTELAICKFVWPITPIRNSYKKFAHYHCYGRPRRFLTDSSWSHIDHLLSNSIIDTLSNFLLTQFLTRFHYDYFTSWINLATIIQSLARFSKRMIRKTEKYIAIFNFAHPLSYYHYLVSESISEPYSGYLFNVLSQYYSLSILINI